VEVVKRTSACVSNTISIDTRRGYAGTSTVARRSQSSPSLGPNGPRRRGCDRSDRGSRAVAIPVRRSSAPVQSEVSI
jgi:hypothetical protein